MWRWRSIFMALLAAGALAGCNSAGDVLQPSPVAPQAAQPAIPSPAASPAPATPVRNAAILVKTRLRIAPLVGMSVEAAGPLTARLNLQARQRGVTLVGSADQSATNILKGYFSVLTEGKDTSVIYVWDLYDMSGNRLHRINGQEKAPSVEGAEGWAAVSPATIQAVADATMDELAAWLSGKTG